MAGYAVSLCAVHAAGRLSRAGKRKTQAKESAPHNLSLYKLPPFFLAVL
jgi:hypothetical protein